MTAESLVTTCIFLLSGGITTIAVWAVTIVFSLPLALVLTVVRSANSKPVNLCLDTYLTVVRGTPLLFQLMFIYFGLPLLLGIPLSPFMAASLAFVNSWTVYLSEIFRGGVEAVDRGQYEAGQVLGLSYFQIMKEIVIPQALVSTLPAVANQAVEAIWGTSLLSVIGMDDLLKSARVLIMRDFTIWPFIVAGAIYLAFNGLVSLLFRILENYTARYRLPKRKYL